MIGGEFFISFQILKRRCSTVSLLALFLMRNLLSALSTIFLSYCVLFSLWLFLNVLFITGSEKLYYDVSVGGLGHVSCA